MRSLVALTGAVLTIAATMQADADSALFASDGIPQLQPTWAWVGGAAILGLAIGFVAGWRVLARRIRKKYGGLKIY